MSLYLIFGIAVYVIVALVCWRFFAGWVAWSQDWCGRKPSERRFEGPDWKVGVFLGCIGALFFPLTLLVAGLSTVPWSKLLGPFPVSKRELKGQLTVTRRDLEKAERELGLK